MFKINDYVINPSTGLCQITAVQADQYTGCEYFILHPLYQHNMTVKIPVQNAASLLNPVVSKREALLLIASIPDLKPLKLKDSKERSSIVRSAMKRHDNEALLAIIKALYLEKKSRSTQNLKLSRTDEELLSAAEKQLHGEFAIALDIPPAEVVPYIADYIARLENRHFN